MSEREQQADLIRKLATFVKDNEPIIKQPNGEKTCWDCEEAASEEEEIPHAEDCTWMSLLRRIESCVSD